MSVGITNMHVVKGEPGAAGGTPRQGRGKSGKVMHARLGPTPSTFRLTHFLSAGYAQASIKRSHWQR